LTTTGSISGASVSSVSGSGAAYTVTVNTGSGDGSLRLDLNPSGTGISDSAGNAISGGFTGGESYTIDKTTPTVVSITRAGADPTNAATATFTVTFSEPVTGLDSADFSLTTTGSISGASVSSVSGSGAAYTVTVNTGSGDGSLRLDLNPSGTGISDSAGNAISGGFTGGESYTIDKTTPTVVSITRAGADPTNAATATFTVTFSEPVTGLDSADFSLTTTGSISGASVSSVSGSGAAYTVTVNTGSGDGSLRLDLNPSGTGISDSAGNAISGGFTGGESYTIDKTTPTVVSITRAGADPTNAATATFTVTFSEPVTGLDSADFSLTTTGSISGASVSSVSGSGAAYTVTVNTGSGDGSLRLDLNPSGTGISDSAGNAISGGFTGGESYTIDKTTPTVVSITRAGADPTNAATATFTVTFSEPVTGLDSADFSLTTTGSISGASVSSVSGSGAAYTVTVNTGSGDGSLRLDLNPSGTGISDSAGNAISGGFTGGESYTIDKTTPTVVSITRAGADPTNAATATFTVTFSEPVTGLDSADFSLTTTGSISGASVSSVSGSGAAYTVTVTTGSGDGSLRLDISATATITDLAGNTVGGLPFTGGESYTVDRSLLTVTINQAPTQTDPAISSPIRFIVIFSKPINPTTFTTSDISLGGSAPGTLTVTITEIAPNNGTTFEIVVSGMNGTGTVIASIPANVVQDPAGNGNTASTSTDNEVTYQPEIRIYVPVIMR
ncbi:MAG: Ig-like domain-containing protein, partial [Chloroflexus sp.]|uniref:beta strand repeat-containing protein n=1 Tax=Chloroflexus sp. TaxID=1904827 RepID=UPI00309F0D94